ncbi:MAG: hypothetical protein GY758_26345 [Fuerstiella sp.]|nr:hypothetical protein [Fuerstiella sp.]MCP4510213.1 hypothetical protein [Fuerstiella sp.]
MARAPASRKRRTKSPTFRQRVVCWAFRPTRLVLAAALALSWLFWSQVERKLPQLETREEYHIGPEHVIITPPPHWVPPDLVEQVFVRAGFDESLSLLDPSLSEKIALAFYTHPWIEGLKQVRKSFPARVHVEVVYREPVAMVEVVGGGYYPIDRHGHLLPNTDFSAADIDRYPVIKDVTSVPLGNLGESWGDPAVQGAAQLSAVLTRNNEAGQSWWTALGLETIRAPRRLAVDDEVDDLQFRIETSGGSQILWGRAPTTRHPGELTVAKKLKRMAEYHQINGFDDALEPFVLDIRPWRGTKRSLLAAEPDSSTRQ